MSGDNPHEAVTAFLKLFRAVLGVLDGKGVIVVPRHGSWIIGKAYSWVLNPQDGMKLGDAGTLYASMQFEVRDYGVSDPKGLKRFRVATLGYNYKLEQPGRSDRWRMHWHPDGASDMREPHLHIPPDLKVHRPCYRMPFEAAIRWCIEDGASLICTLQKAKDELSRLEELTRLSWASAPDLPWVPDPRSAG